MIHISPVRPQQHTPSTSEGGAAASQEETPAGGHEEVDLKDVLQDDDGKDLILHDGENAAALPPRQLRSPTTMTPAQKAIHDLTHMPPDPGCAICRSTRAPNMKHPQSHAHIQHACTHIRAHAL